jgi:uncharacterized protein (TIGR02145 family)
VKKSTVIAKLIYLSIIFIMLGCDDQKDIVPIMETGSVVDIEGNNYTTVKIGNQWWMTENLKVKRFSNGELISELRDNEAWSNAIAPGYCSFNNNGSSTGLLYNFHTIESDKNIAPYGWHVPTDEDWKILEEYLGMSVSELDETNWRGTDQGDQLKIETTGTTGWVEFEDVWGTNTTGFSALGSSCRVFNGEWGIPPLRHSEFWWTSTKSNGYGWFRSLDYKKSGIFRYNTEPNYGFSIRCVKN